MRHLQCQAALLAIGESEHRGLSLEQFVGRHVPATSSRFQLIPVPPDLDDAIALQRTVAAAMRLRL
jgi:hypothetical protein